MQLRICQLLGVLGRAARNLKTARSIQSCSYNSDNMCEYSATAVPLPNMSYAYRNLSRPSIFQPFSVLSELPHRSMTITLHFSTVVRM